MHEKRADLAQARVERDRLRGILLTGGGALLKGIDVAISQATQIPIYVAEDPLTAVVRGTGYLLDNLDLLKNIASPSTLEEGSKF